MKSKILGLAALAAGVALCLSACASAPAATNASPWSGAPSAGQVDASIELYSAVLSAARQAVAQDVQAGLVDPALATRLAPAFDAAQHALLAAEDAYHAGDAATEQDRITEVAAAVVEINSALVQALAAAGKLPPH